MERKIISLAAVAVLVIIGSSLMGISGCDDAQPVSASGVSKANVTVPTGSDGLTIEQRNVRDRVLKDNEPGSIKHLYIISAYSGQTIIYSTVRGKVTSSGKRLTPSNVQYTKDTTPNGFAVDIGGHTHYTSEVLGDDGTYGGSVEYLFWFDAKGIYHQHYVSGGQIVHVSSEPVGVKGVIINMAEDSKSSR
jgi:hypothetical protein